MDSLGGQAVVRQHWVSSRLSEPWDAPSFGMSGKLNKEVLDTILERWLSGDQHLNAPVRCGLVVCIPFLRPALRAALAPELARLLQCASEDDDAWVRILARALGTNPQRTDLDAVAADVPPVGETLGALRSTLAAGQAPAIRDFRPLEEACFSDALRASFGAPQPSTQGHTHFTLRPLQPAREPAPARPGPAVTVQRPVPVPMAAPEPRPVVPPPSSSGGGFRSMGGIQAARMGANRPLGAGSGVGQKRKMQTIDFDEGARCLKQQVLASSAAASTEQLPDELDVRSKAMAAERERLKASMKEKEQQKKAAESLKRHLEMQRQRTQQSPAVKEEQRIKILAAQKEKSLMEQRAMFAARTASMPLAGPTSTAALMASRQLLPAGSAPGARPLPPGTAVLQSRVIAGPQVPLNGTVVQARPQARPTTPSPTAAHVATPTPPHTMAQPQPLGQHAQQPPEQRLALVPPAAP